MMKWVFSGLIAASILFGIISGKMNEVSNAAISECSRAVELVIKLTGSICLWSGLMKVAQESGLTDKIAKLLSPITGKLFKGLDFDSPALKLISMNMTANLLGLGNAATPLGIGAMKELSKEQPKQLKNTASDHMVMLVVMNTASIQLLPTTIALLRVENGSTAPLEILPAILISSFVSVTTGILLCKALSKKHSLKAL